MDTATYTLPVYPIRAFDSVGRILAAEASGLPELSDDTGRPMSWVYVTGEPGFHYMGDFVDIDGQWLDEAIASYAQLARRGYEAPILAEHTSTDGRRLGDLVELRKVKIDGRWALAAAVRWAMPDAHEQIAAGSIRYFSPAIASIEDDATGEILTNVIAELSVVAAPHQKTARTHVLAREQKLGETVDEAVRGMKAGMRLLRERADYVWDVLSKREGFDVRRKMGRLIENIKDAEESVAGFAAAMGIETNEDQMEDQDATVETAQVDGLAALAQRVDALAAAVSKLVEGNDFPADEDEDEDIEKEIEEVEEVEASEVTELRARLGELEDQRDRAVYATGLPVGSRIELTQDVASLLYPLWRANRAAFGAVVGAAIQAPAAPARTVAPVVSPWSVMLGETPGSNAAATLTNADLYAQCVADADGDAAVALRAYTLAQLGD